MTATSHLSTDGGFVLAAYQELEMFEHSAAGADKGGMGSQYEHLHIN